MPRLALILTTLIWGATFPATKAALAQIPPFSFMFLRFLLGALLAVGVYLAMGGRLRADRELLRISGIATIFLFLGYVTQTVGLQYTTASNSAFITVLYVIFVPIFLRRFEGRTWFSAALALTGLWFLIHPSLEMNVGDLLTLACAVTFAAHIACMEAFSRRGEAALFFLWQMMLVTLLLGPTMLIEGPTAAQIAPTGILLVGLGVTGGLATGAFAVQVWAQRVLPAQQVALIFSLEPAFAAWLSWYFLGEQMSADGWIGSALILAGVIIGGLAPGERGNGVEGREAGVKG
ncbi:MAG TPA: DMT family transporter [Nitrospiraceae bacterium]|jgi:drug/metabolite transporter (DMT)-like permease